MDLEGAVSWAIQGRRIINYYSEGLHVGKDEWGCDKAEAGKAEPDRVSRNGDNEEAAEREGEWV